MLSDLATLDTEIEELKKTETVSLTGIKNIRSNISKSAKSLLGDTYDLVEEYGKLVDSINK